MFMHIPASIIFLVFLALVFDFLNGFHDSANAIATIVSTRVLSPRMAVAWAAFFDFSAFFFFGLRLFALGSTSSLCTGRFLTTSLPVSLYLLSQ